MKLKKSFALVCSLLCIAALSSCGNQTNKLLKYVDDLDFSGALDYYDDKVDGSSKESDTKKEFEDELEDRYEKILDAYNNGKVKDKDMDDLFELFEETKVNDDNYEEFMDEYNDLVESKEYYQSAVEYLEEENYSDAIYYFEMVIEDDSNYDDAQTKIEEAQTAQSKLVLQDAQEYIDSGDYSYAMSVLENCEETLGDDEDYKKMVEQVKTAVVADAVEQVDQYFAAFDYYSAESYLENQLYYFENLDELQTMYDELEDSYADYILESAAESFKNKDYEKAASIAQAGLEELDDNTALTDAYAEYKSYLPTYINDLEYFNISGSIYDDTSSEIKDNTNKEHRHSYSIDDWGSGDYWAEYLINGNYNTFTGTCGVSFSNRAKTETKYFEVYGDGILLYTSPTMTGSTLPADFSIDITGVKILKIQYPKTEGSNAIATLYDGLLTRNEDGQETTAAVTTAVAEATTAATVTTVTKAE